MDALKGGVAHQGVLLRVACVVEGQGAEKRDGVAQDERHHQEFE